MEQKHTPAPWYCDSEWGDEIVTDCDGLRVATAIGEKEHRKADARLIAAAPQMLVLLRDCESYAGAMAVIHQSGEGAQLASRCREIIEKLEG